MISLKDKIKIVLSNIVFSLYQKKLIRNKVHVQNMEETIEELLNTNKSLVRFGDGEINIIRGKNIYSQDSSNEIVKGLKRIISYPYEGLIVALPQIFVDVDQYQIESRRFWKIHLLTARKIYNQYCNTNIVYGNAFFSRFYYAYRDKDNCDKWITKIKLLWQNKDIVIVEGITSHNGVGNDLFDGAKSIERIICPSTNAMMYYNEIIKSCRKYSKNFLFLASVGVTAKFLVEDLFLDGYRVIDIGNIDMEYEWYLNKDVEKTRISKYNLKTQEENVRAGYRDYLNQIKVRIGERDDKEY